MTKFYKIILALLVLVICSTFNPIKFNQELNKKNSFFKIQQIEIINNYLIKDEDLKKKLKKIYNKNIFTIKNKDIEEPIKSTDFYGRIEVKKKYPNTIIIKVFETTPIGVLFKDKNKYLIDSSSNIILFRDNININILPTIFGDGAENSFINFFNLLKKNKFPTNEIKSFYFYKIARWDLQLIDDKIIKFPNINTNQAILESIKLLDREDFKNYNIIDLRVGGKIIVE